MGAAIACDKVETAESIARLGKVILWPSHADMQKGEALEKDQAAGFYRRKP